MPCVFNMVEESKDERLFDVLYTEFINAFFQHVGSVAEHQLDGVAISQDGIGRETFLDRQVVAKETLYELGDGVSHDWSPMDLTL